MNIQRINPNTLYDGSPFGLSQATIDTLSGLVFVSGQVDWDTDYELKNRTIEAQAENALKNLSIVLSAANTSVDNILQLRVYIRGEHSEHYGQHCAYNHSVPGDIPSSTDRNRYCVTGLSQHVD
ncbi:RidA family protein [Zooshikella harenae]|uniref:RidA family protein n=1 Tax=Zooshikella harenae TaxID=2827238 RepID=UPI001E3F7635|nr:RidA family protein [Zooshikella harenae]